jgi:hypothetical protein
MKRAIVIALAAVVAAFAVQAGGFGGPMAMGMMPSFEGLNAELGRYNDTFFGGSRGPEFSGPLFFIGGQGKGFVEGFSVGGWGAGFFKEATGDSCKVIMGYGMGYGEFGYRFNIADIVSWAAAVWVCTSAVTAQAPVLDHRLTMEPITTSSLQTTRATTWARDSSMQVLA